MPFQPKSSLAGQVVSFYVSHVTPLEARCMGRLCSLNRHNWLRLVMVAASKLGDWPLWLVSGVVFLAVGDRRLRLAVLASTVAIAASVALFVLVKNLIGRPRPCEVWDNLPCLLRAPDRFSFPSGHTMTAFAAATAYGELAPELLPVFLPAALLIGLSRIFLGLHYPTDVLAGALLGTGLGTLSGQLCSSFLVI
jgi:undecaprenyl-diphosphatase